MHPSHWVPCDSRLDSRPRRVTRDATQICRPCGAQRRLRRPPPLPGLAGASGYVLWGRGWRVGHEGAHNRLWCAACGTGALADAGTGKKWVYSIISLRPCVAKRRRHRPPPPPVARRGHWLHFGRQRWPAGARMCPQSPFPCAACHVKPSCWRRQACPRALEIMIISSNRHATMRRPSPPPPSPNPADGWQGPLATFF